MTTTAPEWEWQPGGDWDPRYNVWRSDDKFRANRISQETLGVDVELLAVCDSIEEAIDRCRKDWGNDAIHG